MTTYIIGRAYTTKNNEMMDKGYVYKVEGDWKVTDRIDEKSEMPEVTCNTWFFTSKGEAENYAANQTWVFNPNVHGIVKVLEHIETVEEYKERVAKENEKRAKARSEREEKEAAQLGMTVADYKEYKKVIRARKRLEKAIEEAEKNLENLKKELDKLN